MSSTSQDQHLPPLPLPTGIVSTYLSSERAGMNIHLLTAGHASPQTNPMILLLHGFPDLAFSWRKVMPALAASGYYVVALDQRGYGRTTPLPAAQEASAGDERSEGWDIGTFTLTGLVRDLVILVAALGYDSVHCVVGHDFGAMPAACSGLMRPDLFKRVVLMSHPFKKFDDLRSSNADGGGAGRDIQADLANLKPGRKHYKWYNSTEQAIGDWDAPEQGMKRFLRGYLHLKSADWDRNNPHPLKGWDAEALAELPGYYVMPLDKSMPQTVAAEMEGEDEGKTERWISDEEMGVYASEWSRTGFRGGLQWYAQWTNPRKMQDVDLFAGKKIDVPIVFISGDKDWGNYQQPGALESMPETCKDFRGVRFVEGAGHWPQQEQPQAVVNEILKFLRETDKEKEAE